MASVIMKLTVSLHNWLLLRRTGLYKRPWMAFTFSCLSSVGCHYVDSETPGVSCISMSVVSKIAESNREYCAFLSWCWSVWFNPLPLPPNPSKPFNIPYYFGRTTSQTDCHSNWRSHDYSGPSPLAVTFDAACFSVDRAFHWLAVECLSLGFDRFAICPLKCYKNVPPSQHTFDVNCNIWPVFSRLVWLYDLKSFKLLQQTWAFSP